MSSVTAMPLLGMVLERVEHLLSHERPAFASTREIRKLHPGEGKLVVPTRAPVLGEQCELVLVKRCFLILAVRLALIPDRAANRDRG
jgi:hypothetical protein